MEDFLPSNAIHVPVVEQIVNRGESRHVELVGDGFQEVRVTLCGAAPA